MRKFIVFLFLLMAGYVHADIAVTEGSGKTVKTATIGSKEVQIIAIYESSNTVTATISGSPTVFLSTVQVVNSTVGITDSGGSITVDNAGTFAVQATQSGTWTVQPGNTQNTTPWITISTNTFVQGMAASSATASGNPIRNGVVVSTSITITPVGAGSIMDMASDPYGRIRITGDSISFASSSGTAVSVSTAAAPVIAAPGAGKHLRIKYVQASNSGATATIIAWREGTTGALRYEVYMPQNGVFAHDLKPDSWDIASNTSLSLYSSAAGNVYYTVEYQTIQD